MTPKRAVQVVITYVLATLACIPTSYVYCWLLADISIRLNWQKAAGILWAFAVGTPSLLWVSRELGRLLGNKAQPRLEIGTRPIALHTTTLADVAKMKWLSKQEQVMDYPEQVSFRYGQVIMTEGEMYSFLRSAWTRQVHGKAPLSRTFHTRDRRHPMTVDEYNAAVAILVTAQLVRGERRQGSKNRLLYDPPAALAALKQLRAN